MLTPLIFSQIVKIQPTVISSTLLICYNIKFRCKTTFEYECNILTIDEKGKENKNGKKKKKKKEKKIL